MVDSPAANLPRGSRPLTFFEFFEFFGFEGHLDGIDRGKVQEVRQVWEVGGSGAWLKKPRQNWCGRGANHLFLIARLPWRTFGTNCRLRRLRRFHAPGEES